MVEREVFLVFFIFQIIVSVILIAEGAVMLNALMIMKKVFTELCFYFQKIKDFVEEGKL